MKQGVPIKTLSQCFTGATTMIKREG